MVKKCLQPVGHEVYSASHAEATLEVMRQVDPELLMCGIMLPGKDGYEMVRHWKSSGGRPAILIAGKGQTVDEVLARQIGVDGVLKYPFKSSDVSDLVERVLGSGTGSEAVEETKVEEVEVIRTPPPARPPSMHSAVLPIPIRRPPPPPSARRSTGVPGGDPLREALMAKFQEVADVIVQHLPELVNRIVEEKLKKR